MARVGLEGRAAVRKRIGSDVEHAHDERAIAERERRAIWKRQEKRASAG